MASQGAASGRAAYIARLKTLSDQDLQSERNVAVQNADLDCLNLVTQEVLDRATQLSTQVSSLQAQVQTGQQQSTAHATVAPTQTSVFVQQTIKIEKPTPFDGTPSKLSNFLFTVKQYMDTLQLQDPIQRCQFAVTLLRGRALTWWRTWCDRLQNLQGTLDFNTFTSELETAFRDVDHVDRLRRKLATLKQTTSVQQYIDQFRNIIIELGTSKPDDDTVLFQFINGLKTTVQLQVRLTRPSNIIQAEQAAEQADSALYLSSRQQFRGNWQGKSNNNKQHSDPMELGNAVQRPLTTRPAIICHRCGKPGHIRKECRVKLPGQQRPQNQTGGPAHHFRYGAQTVPAATMPALPPQQPQPLPPPPRTKN